MKKKVALAAAAGLAAAAVSLSACSGGSGAAGAGEAVQGGSGTENASDDALHLTFYYPVNVGGSAAALIEQICADFNKEHPDIVVEPVYTGNYDDTVTKIQTAIQGGTPPDVFVSLATQRFTMASTGMAMPLDDLIAASQENPGQIKFGISTGGGVYIMASVMANLGGAEFNIIDAGDGATRLTALLGGEVDATSLPYSTAADYIADGQLKSLCTCLSEPPTLLPDQASASDTIPEMQMDTLYAVLAPKGTPAEIVEAMNEAIQEATSTDEWKEICNSYSFQDPYVLNVEDTLATMEEQNALFESFMPYL